MCREGSNPVKSPTPMIMDSSDISYYFCRDGICHVWVVKDGETREFDFVNKVYLEDILKILKEWV